MKWRKQQAKLCRTAAEGYRRRIADASDPERAAIWARMAARWDRQAQLLEQALEPESDAP